MISRPSPLGTSVPTRLKKTLALFGLLLTAPFVFAEVAIDADPAPKTLVMIDDFALTDVHFALFASQTGRNPGDAQGQLSLLNELVNHFMVANSDEGKALADDPDVAAALEVARARLLAQTFVRAQLEANPVEPAEIEALYEERYASSSGIEYKARHILLDDEASAQAVIADLSAGADFAELAQTRSTGPSNTVGGDLGWFEPEQMVAPFAEATAQLENGSYSSSPVKTQFGWHVILREDSREVSPPALDEVKDELTMAVQQRRVAAAITRIRDATRIEVQSLKD